MTDPTTPIEFVPALLFIITLLLGVIGFFLKQLHEVIKNLSNTMVDLKLSLEVTKNDSKRGYDSLKQISEEHGKRLDSHARKIEKNQELIYQLKSPSS